MARAAARLVEGGGGVVVAGDAGAGEEADGGVGRRRSRTALLCFASNSTLGTVKVCVCVVEEGLVRVRVVWDVGTQVWSAKEREAVGSLSTNGKSKSLAAPSCCDPKCRPITVFGSPCLHREAVQEDALAPHDIEFTLPRFPHLNPPLLIDSLLS